jgi:hypothetical protein
MGGAVVLVVVLVVVDVLATVVVLVLVEEVGRVDVEAGRVVLLTCSGKISLKVEFSQPPLPSPRYPAAKEGPWGSEIQQARFNAPVPPESRGRALTGESQIQTISKKRTEDIRSDKRLRTKDLLLMIRSIRLGSDHFLGILSAS